MNAAADENKENKTLLSGNQYFRKLPDRTQNLILESSIASAQFAKFFRDGGSIIQSQEEILASYLEHLPQTNLPAIRINPSYYPLVNREKKDTSLQESDLFAMLAHEIGHHTINSRAHPFTGATREGNVLYRAEHEAMAILNAFKIFDELYERDPSYIPRYGSIGYGSDARMAVAYKEWGRHHDVRATINELSGIVLTSEDTRTKKGQDNVPDYNNDGVHTHAERYRRDWGESENRRRDSPGASGKGRTSQDHEQSGPAALNSKSETDILFDRMYEALASKDSQTIRAARQDYFQSQDGREFLQEVGEYRQTQEHRAHAQGLGRSHDGYSIGALTGKRDPRDWDHPDHALYSAIRRQLPAEVPDDMAAHVMLQAKQGGVDQADKIDAVAVHDGKAWVLGKNFAGHAEVDLSQSPPAMQDTVRQSEIFDQQQAQQREQWLAQEQQLSRNGPSMSR